MTKDDFSVTMKEEAKGDEEECTSTLLVFKTAGFKKFPLVSIATLVVTDVWCTLLNRLG